MNASSLRIDLTDPQSRDRVLRLLDIYEQELSVKQAAVLRQYLEQDLSLSELAETLHIRRQAVHELLHRGMSKLQQSELQQERLYKLELRARLWTEIHEQIKSAKNSAKEERAAQCSLHLEHLETLLERLLHNGD